MNPLTHVTGKVIPMDRENVDTDAIMPKQFLKATNKLGFGANLFDSWRFLDTGQAGQDPATRVANPTFVLNLPKYHGASVLVARDNFGCGSSREHAPWGLLQFGIKAVLAPSFGDIFANNSLKNGLLVVQLSANQINTLLGEAQADGIEVEIDLATQRIKASNGIVWDFDIDPFRKRCLLLGADDIALALSHSDRIREYEAGAALARPWSFRRITL